MLNLKHLYYFHIFAQDLNTTVAAKRLGISLPALSNQLKELEGFLGFKLTERIQGKVAVSELGQRVVQYADRMFRMRISSFPDFRSARKYSDNYFF